MNDFYDWLPWLGLLIPVLLFVAFELWVIYDGKDETGPTTFGVLRAFKKGRVWRFVVFVVITALYVWLVYHFYFEDIDTFPLFQDWLESVN